ncbi:cupin domain-containing protein [Pseudoalteromonas sp. C2R02]|uniref:cupin domain-containing protein n=1 Tax=Pseudoalteromonas sp. C2R02 TaxID=2841565 RepID=UPI001C09129E|nr:cupin domain-containing protein [Pseudoalteromonas sp. C2R02]MBU2970909.1 cupin domain-containing protein [Pseudoalteromonas sp. C2R02]
MIKNYITCDKVTDQNSHDGQGEIEIQKVFRREELKGVWDFALRVTMPANSSMGSHMHGDEEEMYIILKGQGVMTIDGKQQSVVEGDMILNRPFGEHGLLNNSDKEIVLLIIQASNKTV